MSEAPGPLGARSWAWLGFVPAWVWDAIPVAVVGCGVGLYGIASDGALLAPVLIGLIAAASLAWRRRAPLVVLGITGSVTFASIVTFSLIAVPAAMAVLVALYTVDTRCSRRRSLAASAAALCGAILADDIASGTHPQVLAAAVAPTALITALWLIGDNVRVRRAYVAGLEERAVWVDAQREAEARRAADNERARIARELHDVVAHHVAVMAVQAGAARMLNESVDQQTRDLLGSIESSAHQAMSELRRLLGVLRREDSCPRTAGPQPGLGQLGQLIDQVRQAGLPVELTVIGETHSLPGSVDLSAYRIVQEALTNVLKHAGPTPTSVCLRSDVSQVTLVVANQTPAPEAVPAASGEASDRPGHGLIGMRERVAMAGGELRAGQTADGGFEVFARLPVDARRPAERPAPVPAGTAGRP